MFCFYLFEAFPTPPPPHLLATAQQIEDFCLPTNVKSEISFTLGLMFEGEMKKLY
jgi:hypothetical protein